MTDPRIKIGDRPAGRAKRSDLRRGAFPVLRIGVVSGVTGILCCAGPTVPALLGWLALRRRNACSADGVKRLRRRLAGAVAVAVVTYAILYGVTTWLGTLAH